MPELPEVKVVRDKLNTYVSGNIIIKSNVFNNKSLNVEVNDFNKTIKNKKIIKVENKSKFLILFLENDAFIVNHLRMNGNWRYSEIENKNTIASFVLSNGKKLLFDDVRKFATLELFKSKDSLDKYFENKLAPEPKNIDVKKLFSKISNKSIPIKNTLLDQKIISGIGNIYACESLFLAKVDPFKKTKDVSLEELKKIVHFSNKIMEDSYKMGGSTVDTFNSFDNEKGEYQNNLKVYGRRNKECLNCKNIIKYAKISGRGTTYCDFCQN